MAGLFGIFNEMENTFSLPSNRAKENPQIIKSSKIKSIENAESMSTKSFVQPHNKPKGLSIRSKSDLNVSTLNNFGSTKSNLKNQQTNSIKKSISPFKMKVPKSKSLTNITGKKLSPKILFPIMQNTVDDFVFRKPATPKESKNLIKYPQPEKLSYDFDQWKYMSEEMEKIFNEECMWLRSVRKNDDSIVSVEDEGFISDAEFDSFEIRMESLSPLSCLSDVELPEISDSDD